METYTFLRQWADSWFLLAMFIFFIGVMLWVVRPGSNAKHRDTANVVFRHEHKPPQSEDLER